MKRVVRVAGWGGAGQPSARRPHGATAPRGCQRCNAEPLAEPVKHVLLAMRVVGDGIAGRVVTLGHVTHVVAGAVGVLAVADAPLAPRAQAERAALARDEVRARLALGGGRVGARQLAAVVDRDARCRRRLGRLPEPRPEGVTQPHLLRRTAAACAASASAAAASAASACTSAASSADVQQARRAGEAEVAGVREARRRPRAVALRRRAERPQLASHGLTPLAQVGILGLAEVRVHVEAAVCELGGVVLVLAHVQRRADVRVQQVRVRAARLCVGVGARARRVDERLPVAVEAHVPRRRLRAAPKVAQRAHAGVEEARLGRRLDPRGRPVLRHHVRVQQHADAAGARA